MEDEVCNYSLDSALLAWSLQLSGEYFGSLLMLQNLRTASMNLKKPNDGNIVSASKIGGQAPVDVELLTSISLSNVVSDILTIFEELHSRIAFNLKTSTQFFSIIFAIHLLNVTK